MCPPAQKPSDQRTQWRAPLSSTQTWFSRQNGLAVELRRQPAVARKKLAARAWVTASSAMALGSLARSVEAMPKSSERESHVPKGRQLQKPRYRCLVQGVA